MLIITNYYRCEDKYEDFNACATARIQQALYDIQERENTADIPIIIFADFNRREEDILALSWGEVAEIPTTAIHRVRNEPSTRLCAVLGSKQVRAEQFKGSLDFPDIFREYSDHDPITIRVKAQLEDQPSKVEIINPAYIAAASQLASQGNW